MKKSMIYFLLLISLLVGAVIALPRGPGSSDADRTAVGEGSLAGDSSAFTATKPDFSSDVSNKGASAKADKYSTIRTPANYEAIQAYIRAGNTATLMAALKDPANDATVRNEAANYLSRVQEAELIRALSFILDNPSELPLFRAYATQHLGLLADAGRSSNAQALAKLHELLGDTRIEVRREAVLALARKNDHQAVQIVLDSLKKAKVETNIDRDVAIRCLKDLDRRDQIPNIRPYAKDSNEATQIAALVALSQWKDEESRDVFIAAADSKNARVQRAGKMALQRLGDPKAATAQTPPEKAPASCCGDIPSATKTEPLKQK